jgi:hypothetical protein
VDSGERLVDPILSALCIGRWRARRQSHLGRHYWLRCSGDSAQCGESEWRGGEAPASARGRLRVRARKLTAPTTSSPPSAASGQLVDGKAAVATKISSGSAG